MPLIDKKDLSVLRIAASLWLEQHPGHQHEEHVRRALEKTNIPQPKLNGRPKIPDELRKQVIEMKHAGSSDRSIGMRLGISRTAVARIWKGKPADPIKRIQ